MRIGYGGEIGEVVGIGDMIVRRVICEWYKRVRSGRGAYYMVV